jgi:hypothetical protein
MPLCCQLPAMLRPLPPSCATCDRCLAPWRWSCWATWCTGLWWAGVIREGGMGTTASPPHTHHHHHHYHRHHHQRTQSASPSLGSTSHSSPNPPTSPCPLSLRHVSTPAFPLPPTPPPPGGRRGVCGGAGQGDGHGRRSGCGPAGTGAGRLCSSCLHDCGTAQPWPDQATRAATTLLHGQAALHAFVQRVVREGGREAVWVGLQCGDLCKGQWQSCAVPWPHG